jgi:hypothetical protein
MGFCQGATCDHLNASAACRSARDFITLVVGAVATWPLAPRPSRRSQCNARARREVNRFHFRMALSAVPTALSNVGYQG